MYVHVVFFSKKICPCVLIIEMGNWIDYQCLPYYNHLEDVCSNILMCGDIYDTSECLCTYNYITTIFEMYAPIS